MTTKILTTRRFIAALLSAALLGALPFTASLAQNLSVNPPAGATSYPASQGAQLAPNYGSVYGSGYPPSYPPVFGSGYAYPRYQNPGYQNPGYQNPGDQAYGYPSAHVQRPAANRTRLMPELIQDITADGYRLTIRLNPGQQPEDIQVAPRGRGLVISSARERFTRSEQEQPNGRGYSRSFSFSSGRFQRRLGVPPDANLAAMTRSDEEDRIVILLPRR